MLNGTVRTFNPDLRQDVKERLERIVQATCDMYQATYELKYKLGYPTVINDAEEAERFFQVGAQIIWGRGRTRISSYYGRRRLFLLFTA